MKQREESDTRLTIRLRPAEVRQLDTVLNRLRRDRHGRWVRPYSRGRNYEWSRGDVLRLGLRELAGAIAASDADLQVDRQTISTSGSSDNHVATRSSDEGSR